MSFGACRFLGCYDVHMQLFPVELQYSLLLDKKVKHQLSFHESCFDVNDIKIHSYTINLIIYESWSYSNIPGIFCTSNWCKHESTNEF